MATNRTRTAARDLIVQQIDQTLRMHYLPTHPEAQVDVRRYNSASVRVRVIDPTFAAIAKTRRDTEVWGLLKQHLDEDVLGDVSLLLLLAPGEEAMSLMNHEFENPTPSRL